MTNAEMKLVIEQYINFVREDIILNEQIKEQLVQMNGGIKEINEQFKNGIKKNIVDELTNSYQRQCSINLKTIIQESKANDDRYEKMSNELNTSIGSLASGLKFYHWKNIGMFTIIAAIFGLIVKIILIFSPTVDASTLNQILDAVNNLK